MITLARKRNEKCYIVPVWEHEKKSIGQVGIRGCFGGNYLEILPWSEKEQIIIYIGCGKQEEINLISVKEIAAKAAAKMKELNITECSFEAYDFVTQFGRDGLVNIVLGLGLGGYSYEGKKSTKKEPWECNFSITGITKDIEIMEEAVEEGLELLKGVVFARNMVNMPGNYLRPMDFERFIKEYVKDTGLEMQTLVYGQLRAMKMEPLYSIGQSSDYPPCMVILRYKGDPTSNEIYGLIGKGITCDTGGYCLKAAGSMGGIKSDMAGAAAVTAAMHAIASRKLKVNVTACLPLSENRISQTALLPGDVITGYSGKTIEVLNTDAEGRLVLSDAISYGIRVEGITKVLDIATLTGAVANMLGNTIAGAVSDNDEFYSHFEAATKHSAERYLRIPYGKEHLKMIQSNVADLKNTGESHCGTITAGLFLREFCEGKPWIHLDVAGTAWCGTPTYAFETSGATGAAVTTLYYLMKEVQSK